MRVALFPGSFDPFTIGHYDIVERALGLFDRVVIAIGENNTKQPIFPLDERLAAIRKAFADQPRVEVVSYSDLTVDLAQRIGAQFIIRGVRDTRDFEYERSIAEANKQLGNIETVLLYTRPEYAHISSTLVRDLLKHGRDVKEFIV